MPELNYRVCPGRHVSFFSGFFDLTENAFGFRAVAVHGIRVTEDAGVPGDVIERSRLFKFRDRFGFLSLKQAAQGQVLPRVGVTAIEFERCLRCRNRFIISARAII